jgi:hypothetical protein
MDRRSGELFPLRCRRCPGCLAHWAWQLRTDVLEGAPSGLIAGTLHYRGARPAPALRSRLFADLIRAVRFVFPAAQYLSVLDLTGRHGHEHAFFSGVPVAEIDELHAIVFDYWSEPVDYLEPDEGRALHYALKARKLLAAKAAHERPVRYSRGFLIASRVELHARRRAAPRGCAQRRSHERSALGSHLVLSRCGSAAGARRADPALSLIAHCASPGASCFPRRWRGACLCKGAH